MTFLDILEAQLAIDEGKQNKMYMDSMGIPTIGIGHNLRDKPISDAAIHQIFQDDTMDAVADARKLLPIFDTLTEGRKAVLVNMAFNLGYFGLSQFHHTLALITSGDYAGAADAMMDSSWAKQVGQRAVRLSNVMRNG